jgi:phosphate transport system protein
MLDGHHLRSAFDQRYIQIRDDLLRMGQMVDNAIARAVTSLKEADQGLARHIIAEDLVINALRSTIEEECLVLIATQQPTAVDLRAVITAMFLTNEMERIADHAAGIAKAVIRMGEEPLVKPLVDIPWMADLARDMLKQSLDAYLARDVRAAHAIAARDDEIDRLYRNIFQEALKLMASDPSTIAGATYLLWCGHNLERIGDRVTNIAERIVFMTTGTVEDLNQ